MGPAFNAWPLGQPSQHKDNPSPPPPASSSRHPAISTLPFGIRTPFQLNQSSATLVSSTAEGKPIPVDDSVVETRTSALRELNNHYPSRHRYAKSTGAQSTTYSEPVIVRSYYPPVSTKIDSFSRRGVLVRHSQPTTATENEGTAVGVRRVNPFSTTVASARNGTISDMARARVKKLLRVGTTQEPRLPPVEAFTFKSFMANMESQAGPTDISADLDRIAEICAKSRYSLSNQYEVHYQPHGSGSTFIGRNPAAGQDDHQGPTLQVIHSDDENSTRNRRRRGLGRRNSRAMGTLETIISSSRSSDEERSRKKSASELAQQVRGRATTKANSTGSGSSHSTRKSKDRQRQAATQDLTQTQSQPVTSERRNSTLALIDTSKHPNTVGEPSSPRSSAPGLVSQPALPQASTSQLELRTAPENESQAKREIQSTEAQSRPSERVRFPFSIKGAAPPPPTPESTSLLSNLTSWMPWNSTNNGDPAHRRAGRAEGSLRDLLRGPRGKGDSVS